MAIERFEDLRAWQEARKLVKEVYTATSSEPFARDYELVRQIRRSGISVMSNLAEGCSKFSAKERKQFYARARSSLDELRSQAYVAADQGYMNKQQHDALSQRVEGLGRMITGLVRASRVTESPSHRVTAVKA